jgi:glycosyltransferase involved in cell wall biosynthesis
LSKAVICDGDDVRRQLVDEQKLWPRNVVTIHNGVDTQLYGQTGDKTQTRAAARRALGLAEDTPVLATVARLEPVKDQATLLRAFEKVGAALPESRLVLVGDGSVRPALEEQARQRGLAGRVIFLGRRADVAQLLPLFDAFVLTSTSEGLPLTILEAMGVGIPVVATRVGGVPELVDDGETGILVEPADAVALGRALDGLSSNVELCVAMGKAGALKAAQEYAVSDVAERLVDLYGELTGRRERAESS